MTTLDRYARPLGSLRLSVTDRCNLRCTYCMPEDDYVWLPKESLLTFEEMTRLVRVFGELGAGKVRITGGEPLLRRDLDQLVAMIAAESTVRDLALTTNGVLLASQVDQLRAAGLQRVTVSLDTLDAQRFTQLNRSSRHADVLAGIGAARRAGLSVKLNTVVMRGVNDDELVPLLAFALNEGVEARFIEYMDVGGATEWDPAVVVSRDEMLVTLREACGDVEPISEPGSRAPADRFRLPGGQVFGIISSTTEPFCRDCDRSRITADGTWFLCLYADSGVDLRAPLREGATDDVLRALIEQHWSARTDRGAEQRLTLRDREPLYQIAGLRADPHREMHTRGG